MCSCFVHFNCFALSFILPDLSSTSTTSVDGTCGFTCPSSLTATSQTFFSSFTSVTVLVIPTLPIVLNCIFFSVGLENSPPVEVFM